METKFPRKFSFDPKAVSMRSLGTFTAVACLLGLATVTWVPQDEDGINDGLVDLAQMVAPATQLFADDEDELIVKPEIGGEQILIKRNASKSLASQQLKVYKKNATSMFSVSCKKNIERMNASWNRWDWENYKDIPASDGIKYEDEDFPAQANMALYWRSFLTEYEMYDKYRKVDTWVRPEEYYKLLKKDTKVSLWGSKGVLPDGVQQGALGDCWFLAAAAALAEHPERVKKIFTNTEISGAGIYQVTFYKRGLPLPLVVDDRIPLSPNPNHKYYDQLMNAGVSPNGAWWLVILEKAYAKWNVNYANLNGGSPAQSLRDLTGMPVQRFVLRKQNDDEFWATILEADQRNWPIVAACMRAARGLVPGHAYTLVGVAELTKNGRPYTKLVKMRNPWGSETYAGPWRDNDPQWTPEFKSQVNLEPDNDGTFYMPFDQFRDGFDAYSFAMYEDWQVERKIFTKRGQQFKQYVESPVDQMAILTLDYQNARQYPPTCTQPSHGYNIFIKDITAGGQQIQKAVLGKMGYGNYRFEGGLIAGHKYLVMVYDFEGNVDQDFTLTLYTKDKKVKFERN